MVQKDPALRQLTPTMIKVADLLEVSFGPKVLREVEEKRLEVFAERAMEVGRDLGVRLMVARPLIIGGGHDRMSVVATDRRGYHVRLYVVCY